MAIENSVADDFLSTFVNSINVFDCHLLGLILDNITSAAADNAGRSESI